MAVTIGIVALDAVRGNGNSSSAQLAFRRLGDQSLLSWVVGRVSDAFLLDRVIVTSGDFPVPPLPPDVEIDSSNENPAQRVTRIVDQWQPTAVMRVSLRCVRFGTRLARYHGTFRAALSATSQDGSTSSSLTC